jgi:two-component system, OmpR family, response regulator
MRVLVVEDHVELASLIRKGATRRGLARRRRDKGEDALWMAGSTPYYVMTLDVALPGLDGFETCRRLRDDGVQTPILMRDDPRRRFPPQSSLKRVPRRLMDPAGTAGIDRL